MNQHDLWRYQIKCFDKKQKYKLLTVTDKDKLRWPKIKSLIKHILKMVQGELNTKNCSHVEAERSWEESPNKVRWPRKRTGRGVGVLVSISTPMPDCRFKWSKRNYKTLKKYTDVTEIAKQKEIVVWSTNFFPLSFQIKTSSVSMVWLK